MEIKSEVSGTVWKVEISPGAKVVAGDILIILESMKMEIPVEAPGDGKVVELLVSEKDVIKDGQTLAIMELG